MRNLQILEINGFPHPEAAICMWVGEIAQQQRGELWFQATALLSLQEVLEAYV